MILPLTILEWYGVVHFTFVVPLNVTSGKVLKGVLFRDEQNICKEKKSFFWVFRSLQAESRLLKMFASRGIMRKMLPCIFGFPVGVISSLSDNIGSGFPFG